MPGAWELKKQNKVVTVILHTGVVSFAWAANFRRMKIPGPDPIGLSGYPFDHARNVGAKMMLDTKAEWLFFLDSDICTPVDCVERLIARGKPVISALYCRRSPPQGVPVARKNGQWLTTIPGPGQDPLVEVDLVGTGALLIHRTVLEQLPAHRPGKPWFDWRVDLQGFIPAERAMSEDFCFCQSVRENLNIPIILDTSIRCRHIGEAEADFGTFTPVGSLPLVA